MTRCALSALISIVFFAPSLGADESESLNTPSLCGGGVLDVDLTALVKTADLRLSGPAPRSEAGLPIGNGRMGTLLWTTPTTLHMQVNRVDVFANNCTSDSFPERHTDYCNGCALVDIDAGGDVFTDNLEQRLSMADGLAVLEGDGVRIRALASMDRDVIAIEVTDDRPIPAHFNIHLRRLRDRIVRRGGHTARSRNTMISFEASPRDLMVLTQDFDEGAYHCGSAVGVSVVGREARLQPEGREDVQVTIVVPARRGKFTVFISSVASFQPDAPLVDEALTLLADAAKEKFTAHLAANRRWWSDFWNRGFVWLHSEGGDADMIQEHYYYYLYLMASTSRGKYPTKFNGMLWTTGGDRRQWGMQYWGANQSCLYNALFPTNRLELLDPMFDMYTGMHDACATAARQQWGSQGVFIPETVAFDGLAELPDDIAEEMRELYLARKPMREASERFLEFSRTKQPHSSRWNWWESGRWVGDDWRPRQRPEAPFGAVTHIFSRGAKIAYMYWQRYEYTGDEAWLRDRAYPMLRGVADFYRNFPNVKKGSDGKYHIHYVNSNESIRGARDTDEEIASMMAIFPTVVRASEILGVDEEMRPLWQEFMDNLAPLPTSDNPEALSEWGDDDRRDRDRRRRGSNDRADDNDDPYWIRALPPAVSGGGLRRPDGNTMPMWFFDLCTLEDADAETMRIANATLDGYGPAARGVLSEVGVAHAKMGRSESVRASLLSQLRSPDRAPVMANRMDLREGPQSTSAQRLGRAADTLHNALLQSTGAGPAQDPVIRVFPGWPKDWDAVFTLLARGNVLVTSSIKDGEVEFVALDPQLGGTCRVRNPWGEKEASLFRDGNDRETLRGRLLAFDTRKGDRVVLIPVGQTPLEVQRSLPPASAE